MSIVQSEICAGHHADGDARHEFRCIEAELVIDAVARRVGINADENFSAVEDAGAGDQAIGGDFRFPGAEGPAIDFCRIGHEGEDVFGTLLHGNRGDVRLTSAHLGGSVVATTRMVTGAPLAER